MDFGSIVTAIGIPVLRSVGGWMTKACADGKIEMFEIKKLGQTVLKTLIYGSIIYFGADGFGFEVEPIAAAASGVIMDMVLSAIKENRNITKR